MSDVAMRALYGIWGSARGRWGILGDGFIGQRFTEDIGVALALYYEGREDSEHFSARLGNDKWRKEWIESGYQVRQLGNDGRPTGEVLNE